MSSSPVPAVVGEASRSLTCRTLAETRYRLGFACRVLARSGWWFGRGQTVDLATRRRKMTSDSTVARAGSDLRKAGSSLGGSVLARRRWDALSPEERVKAARKASRAASKARKGLSKRQLAKVAKKNAANAAAVSPEVARARAVKAWETRRAKKPASETPGVENAPKCEPSPADIAAATAAIRAGRPAQTPKRRAAAHKSWITRRAKAAAGGAPKKKRRARRSAGAAP